MMSSACIVRTAVVRKPGLGLKNLVLFTSLTFTVKFVYLSTSQQRAPVHTHTSGGPLSADSAQWIAVRHRITKYTRWPESWQLERPILLAPRHITGRSVAVMYSQTLSKLKLKTRVTPLTKTK